MNITTKYAALLFAAALFVIGSSWLAWFRANAELKYEINRVEARFEQMSVEHAKAIQAADTAIRMRNEIYEAALTKAVEVENALRNCPDFSNINIPDDLRLLLQNACVRADDSATATKPAGADTDTGPLKSKDNR